MVSIETTTTTEDPKPCDEQPPVFDDITTPAPFETLTAPAHGEPEPLITVGDVDPAALPVPPVAVAPVVKKAAPKKSNAESKEGPMGELRPTDILAGNYRKRAGNYLYKKLLREHAPDVGKIEMKLLVSKVVEGIAGQTPPGRFIREGGDALLSGAQRNQKVARALREVSERSTKEEGEAKVDKVVKKPKVETEKHQEPIGEIRPSDVLTGNYRKRAGNYLYKKLLRDEAPNVAKEEMRTVVNRVIEGIYGQFPPGRFIREGGAGLLTRGQIHQKVARALREVVERASKEVEEKEPGEKVVKKKASSVEKQEPMGEIRPTDVLTGNYRKRAGNALYKKLLRDHAPSVGREEMSSVVTRVVEGIAGQHPPGRFIREGGGALLTRGQVRQKVARALREVVERSKAIAVAPIGVTDVKMDVDVAKVEEEVKVDDVNVHVPEDFPVTPMEELVEEAKEEEDAIEEPKKKRGKKEPEEEEDTEDAKGKKAKKEEVAEVVEEDGKARKTRRGPDVKEEAKPPAKKTRKKDTTSLRWRARVAKTTTATTPSADSETKDGFLKTSLSNDKEKRHIHNNGCFGTGLSWLDGMAAGAVGSSLLVFQQRHLLPIVTHTAAVSTLVMGPYAAYQNRKLRAMGGLRSEHNRLRGDVNEFKVQNEVLLRRMQRLDGAVSSLESAERELSVIVKNQSELERLQRAVARRNQILGEMKQCLVQQVLQDILAVVVRSDRDSDFQISPQELEVLVLRMKAIAGVQFNERNFRGLMAAGDRRIASVFSMIRTLMKDDDDRNDIFTFHPEDLMSHGNHVV